MHSRKKLLYQMYQWYETVDETPVPAALRTGDHDSHSEVTYSYDRAWFDRRIDSMTFRHAMGHHNPEFWIHNASVSGRISWHHVLSPKKDTPKGGKTEI